MCLISAQHVILARKVPSQVIYTTFFRAAGVNESSRLSLGPEILRGKIEAPHASRVRLIYDTFTRFTPSVVLH